MAAALNLIETSEGCTGVEISADPNLGPLQDNGGPTPTHALQTGSPAVDAGFNRCLATDQRGVGRPQGPRCDTGAFELETGP